MQTNALSFFRRTSLGTLAALALGLVPVNGDWPRWRGAKDNGSTEGGNYPIKWDSETVLWKTRLPGKGCSTPIVWKQHIYITAPANGSNTVLAFNWVGQPVWQTTFDREDPGKHRNGSGCNPSATTDGKGVFVYFKSGTLAALELDGGIRWQTNLVARYGPANLYWDYATSPVVTERFVIMAKMHEGDSWVAAFDKGTGEMRWKIPRNYKTPHEGDHGYTTPQVIRHREKEALLVWGALHLTAYDAANGALLWSCGDFNPEEKNMWAGVACPVLAGNVAVVPTGRNDRNQPRLHGIRLGGAGDVTSTHRIWKREDTGSFVPTPVEYKGRIYLLRDRGEVECLDAATGRTVWSDALPKDRSNYYASPIIAGGKLYAAREDGVVFVAGIEKKFELLAENRLGDRFIASPAAVSDRLFIRGEQYLYCMAVR